MKTRIIVIALFLIPLSSLAQYTFIAHRGASYLAPENSLASVQLAWELNADAVEVDIHLSADHRIMVIHDRDTRKTSQGKTKYVVAKTDSDKLRTVDVGSFKADEFAGEKIPFLEDVIATVPAGKLLIVEIKCGPEVLPYLEEVVRRSGKADQLVFISFGWKTILETRAVFPENPCYYLRMSPMGLFKKMDQAAEAGLNGVNLYSRIINKKVVDYASERKLEVLAWTVDEPEEVNRLSKLGVRKITTNRPAWLKKQMAE